MPKLGCKCGYVFQMGIIPNKDEYDVISEIKIDTISLYDENSKPYTGEEIYDAIFLGPIHNRTLLICPECGRLYLEDSEEPLIYHPYVSEEVLHDNNIDYKSLFQPKSKE